MSELRPKVIAGITTIFSRKVRKERSPLYGEFWKQVHLKGAMKEKIHRLMEVLSRGTLQRNKLITGCALEHLCWLYLIWKLKMEKQRKAE